MKNFVKLIERVHEERFSVVINRITARKIPVAFLSLAPVDQAVELTKNLRAQNLNVTRLIVIDSVPPSDNLDFEIVHVSSAAQIYPQPEYVFVTGNIDARFAVKNFPAAKVLNLYRNAISAQAYVMFMNHLSDLREVYESLIDEESKKTFRGYWLGNITTRLSDLVYSSASHYMLAGFIPKAGDIVIDGGVCDGSTTVKFSAMGCKVYGFELDDKNFETAQKVAEENNFVVENFGLGSFNHEAKFWRSDVTPGANRISDIGTEVAQVTTVDSYVRENKLSRVDYIKLDVEGSELDVLRGAAESIIRFKPILALSAYHKLDDFWTLMNFVKSLRPDYEFAMRQFHALRDECPYIFSDKQELMLNELGLWPVLRSFGECVLFAR